MSGESYTLGNNLENLILTGTQDLSGSGNDLDNFITGNSGDNYLEANGGIDTVNYAGAPAAVDVNLGSSSASGWGQDRLLRFENVTGSSFNDTITGDSANNVLTGGAGADRITGGGGADKFDYRVLTDSLLSSGLDVIPDFNANAGGDKLLVGTARAGFLDGGAGETDEGGVRQGVAHVAGEAVDEVVLAAVCFVGDDGVTALL
jgi:Ca2+-binding RTX toxin-like protein